jgi:hypothetical protein
MNPRFLRQPRRAFGGLILTVTAAASLGLGTSFVIGLGANHTSAAGPSIWIQTMDSCRQALGGGSYQIGGTGSTKGAQSADTPAHSPSSVSNGSCPVARGSCSSGVGCTQFTNLAFPGTYQIRQTKTPPSNPSNPQGFAPCNGGSACQGEIVDVSIDSTGKVSATTTNIEPDGTKQVFGSFSGAQSDPVVFHDYGLGTGSCDGDHDADDHLTGGTPAHCGYPENKEASACQPYPWSCGYSGGSGGGGGTPPPPPPPTPTPTPTPPPPPPATHLVLSSPSTAPKAGAPFNETITAEDASNHVVPGYAGGKTLTWSGPGNAPNGIAPKYQGNPVSFSGGTATVSITLYDAQATSLKTSDGKISGASPGFTVAPGPTATLTLTLPSNATFNQAVSASVTTNDAWGNVATGDNSALKVTSSDLLATFPSAVNLKAGSTSFSVTFRTPGNESLTVSESGGPSNSKACSVAL